MSPHSLPTLRTALTWILGALLLAGVARLAADTSWQLFLVALLPAAAAAWAAVRIDRHAHSSRQLLLGAFLWGLVVAPAAALALNELVRAWLGDLTSAAEATHLTGAFAAPALEEIAKATALALLAVVWRRELRGAVDGIVFGALIGIGFTMAENLYYFALAALAGGSAGLAESIYLRAALGGLLHPTFTATTGAGLGWARASARGAGRAVAPWLGLLMAIVQHVAWNAAGAPWLDAATCGPAAAACGLDGRLRYWLLTAPAIVLLFIGPGLVALRLVARRERMRA
ncbi:MAG TPA: PrsW family glutamic-type intramembrane protease [Candidatus Dormibacteraeota bacterium]|nr:PrsW family glutamic-type intramembrane protease [Candidatus Dormibacteraeota bacterium]